ncbi:hypothetical protein [Nitrosophilus kaiyonis]|uniref:hypothetical protein n=1 Tax=Nitrosophilus kaiyonis TaxID=2930200 RepID=UPI0024919715|nr:hypothetical protein [Nitrosophilus kaiyonis]
MRYKILGLLFAALSILGCEKKIYTKIYDKNLAKEKINCLKISSDNILIEYIVRKNPFIKKLSKKECPYSLKISSNYVTYCKSPAAKSLASDFDGYVRFEIYKDKKLFYRSQRDFKGKFDKSVADSLIDKMKRDLNFGY